MSSFIHSKERIKRIKGMTNNNRAEEHMEFDDDMVGKIISHLPLKFVNQCKVSSKKFKSRILNPYFLQLLFQNQQM